MSNITVALTCNARRQTRGWTKAYNKHLWNDMSMRGFEKLWYIPGALEGHIHMQGYVHAQGRPEKVIISHFWLTLRLCTSIKWRLRQSYKFLEHWRGAPTHTQSSSSKAWKLVQGIYGNLCPIISWWPSNWAGISEATYNKEYRLYRISLENSLNKQTSSSNNNNKQQ